jgi:hypothetical protein
VRDLKTGVVDSRLLATLQAVTKEQRVCVVAFKEGHCFLPGVEDSPLIPEGYGEAGVLFSKYTLPGSEVPHRAVPRGPQSRSVIGVETCLLDYLSGAASLVQPGHTLEGFE